MLSAEYVENLESTTGGGYYASISPTEDADMDTGGVSGAGAGAEGGASVTGGEQN